MKNSKITNGNPLPNEVEINLNMLGSLMLNRVGGHVDDTDVVTIHQRSLAKRGREAPGVTGAAKKPQRHRWP